MQVALIGASGNVGQRLLQELIRRGHSVTAIARHTDALPTTAAVTALAADASDSAGLIAAVRDCEAAIVAVRFDHVDTDALIRAIAGSAVPRWLAVGGTGSLRDRSGRLVMENEHFPADILPEATATADFYKKLQGLTSIDWTYLSPSMFFGAGRRDGSYRAGRDDLLMDGDKPAGLSFENFAVAMIDELELGRHIRARFTVADPA